ncbi:hypothetical protein [Pseudomonas azerbaijanorientalis]|uniref:hypothetical protein n=1 Tax=Pseudomonas azerbaijanorientalis TaxID=2842350 RepID=UPI001C3DA5C8|nr:hypothetical protein [Pseudomonas azerbaijanorientalis]QXH64705.1 hypothetical protein KSS91_10020 [Pseudomonas azerbaijanorientalis]
MRYSTNALLILLALIVGCMLLSNVASRATCSYYGFQTDRETRYAAFVGCMVKLDGAWFPRNEIRVMQ